MCYSKAVIGHSAHNSSTAISACWIPLGHVCRSASSPPQVLAPTGAKLSKSLLRDRGKDALPADVEPWMLDTTQWPGDTDHYVDALLWLVGELLTDPKHFFRSFTVKELGRLMTNRPAGPTPLF